MSKIMDEVKLFVAFVIITAAIFISFSALSLLIVIWWVSHGFF